MTGIGLAVLTAASTVTCAHQGKVAAASTTRLRVGNAPVLLADVTDKGISGCPVQDDTSHGIVKCRKVRSASTGQSARLTVGGTSVLLAGLAGLSDGTPPPTGVPLAPALANQTRLRAAVAVA